VDSKVTRSNTAAQTGDEAPPRIGGFWPDAQLWPSTDPALTVVADLPSAGELSRGQVSDMLRTRVGGAAVSHLSNAAYGVGRWFTDHGTEGFRIAVGVSASRVLIEFTDHGEYCPDPYRSRTDADLAHQVLCSYIVGWGWKIGNGIRTLRIFADADSPTVPTGRYFE
jgi:hypothetical protein